jgi:hypothetical protein
MRLGYFMVTEREMAPEIWERELILVPMSRFNGPGLKPTPQPNHHFDSAKADPTLSVIIRYTRSIPAENS